MRYRSIIKAVTPSGHWCFKFILLDDLTILMLQYWLPLYSQLLSRCTHVTVIICYLFDRFCFKFCTIALHFLGHTNLLVEWLVYRVHRYGFFSIAQSLTDYKLLIQLSKHNKKITSSSMLRAYERHLIAYGYQPLSVLVWIILRKLDEEINLNNFYYLMNL